MNYFFDTNALLNHFDSIAKGEFSFGISHITLKELENIKVNQNKDYEVKITAKKAAKFLFNNPSRYSTIISLEEDWESLLYALPLNDDTKIIASAIKYSKIYPNTVFFTEDINCYNFAREVGLNCGIYEDSDTEYHGFKEITLSDEDLAYFYSDIFSKGENVYQLYNNEYLIIKNKNNDIIDKYKWINDKYEVIPYISFDSKAFGKIKPKFKDAYQEIAFDSISTNEITLLGGPAGSGKTYISLSYFFSMLEKGKIDRIVIFCNPVVAKNAAKLGFYPGTRNEKLLSSQVGAVLSSKLGSISAVERLIEDEQLFLIPVGDARGYEVPAHQGVYIMEAQNLTCDLMRLILQRIGEECITIVDGDRKEQTDLDIYSGSNNGMSKMSDTFKGQPFFGQVDLQKIHRSKIATVAENMK